MHRSFAFVSLVIAVVSSPEASSANDELALRLLGHLRISDAFESFDEPSGLALDPSGHLLWSVSDDTRMVFAINPNGQLNLERSFEIDNKNLEGIAGLSAGKLVAVEEGSNEILVFGTDSGRTLPSGNSPRWMDTLLSAQTLSRVRATTRAWRGSRSIRQLASFTS